MRTRDLDATLADLRDGKLREIGPKIGRLNPPQARSVSREVQRQLSEIVARRSLGSEDRWLVTALQYLAPPDAGDLLTRALGRAIRLRGCCGCVRNRLLRAVGAVRPPQAIPALVDLLCQVDNPIHKHLAAVCVQKIVQSHDGDALALLHDQARRLRRELRRLERQVGTVKPVTPDRPWHRPPGSPGWSASADRAITALRRLLGEHAP